MKLCGHCRNRGKNSRCNLYTEISNYAEKCKDFKPKKQTNADRIRSMSDEELAEWLTNMCDFINPEDEEPYKSIYNIDTEKEETIHDGYGSIMEWLQSEVEV